MAGQKREVTEAKEQDVRDALNSAIDGGGEVTIRGVARAAGVDHLFIMRRPELRDAIQAQRRYGMSWEDVHRTRGGVPLSDSELDLTDRAARRAGMPLAAYWREVILEAAAADLDADPDGLDTARRPARRRRNYSQRQREEGQR